MFDWLSFLRDHNIPFSIEGKTTTKGNVEIKCPWCGDEDPSQHLGIHLKLGYWNCWRNSQHRGRKPYRLIMRLLGCSYEVADGIVTGGRELSRFEELAEEFRSKGNPPDEAKSNGVLEMPNTFRPLTFSGRGRMFANYLCKRGFNAEDIPSLTKKYNLRFCMSGYWHNRIIFPLRFEGRLVSWTARTINPNNELRYVSLSEKSDRDQGSKPALRSIKRLIWNYDALEALGGKTLAVVEGPLDALKVDFYGRSIDVRATCLFGTGITDDQRLLLSTIWPRFDRLVIIPDRGAMANGMKLMNALGHLRPRVINLPYDVEDPGAMTREQVEEIFVRI